MLTVSGVRWKCRDEMLCEGLYTYSPYSASQRPPECMRCGSESLILSYAASYITRAKLIRNIEPYPLGPMINCLGRASFHPVVYRIIGSKMERACRPTDCRHPSSRWFVRKRHDLDGGSHGWVCSHASTAHAV